MGSVRQLAPSQLASIDQTSNICTKLINAQVGCVTNVDSYSWYSMLSLGIRPLFAAVTKSQQFEEKTTNICVASGFIVGAYWLSKCVLSRGIGCAASDEHRCHGPGVVPCQM